MAIPHLYPVILAGGASSRLWPASNRERPKWDLRLCRDASGAPQTLLENAWARACGVAVAGDCFVVCGGEQAERVRASLPDLPADNLLIEPEPRDTSGAVAYALGAVLRKGAALENGMALENGADLGRGAASSDDPVMLVLPGDHVISPLDKFAACALAGATAAVDLNACVTFGIVARGPSTAYGYIRRGEAVTPSGGAGKPTVYRVREFKEKPDRATAEAYLKSGEYDWNGGIFLWRTETVLAELRQQLPAHASMAEALARTAPGSAAWDALAREHFPQLKKISIDFGIMEHASAVATVAADFDWDDIGSWSAVAAHLDQHQGNAVGPATDVIAMDAAKNVVFAPGKRVALIGVENVAVVQVGDEILVCRIDRDQDVKQASQEAAKRGKV